MTPRILAADPAAPTLLRARIALLEEERNTIKLANKMVSSRNREGLARLGFAPSQIEELFAKGGFSAKDIRKRTTTIDNLKRRLAAIRKDHAHVTH